MAISVKDLTGQRFGWLTVLEFVRMDESHHSVWRCRCACGGEKIASSNEMKQGRVGSCGCKKLLLAQRRRKKGNQYGGNNERLEDLEGMF